MIGEIKPWNHKITEIIPGKFHLESVDPQGCIFWCKKPFQSQERADKFAQRAANMICSYDYLMSFAEFEYAFFEKFFLLVEEQFLYRNWFIEVQEICNDLYLTLHDPLGGETELPFTSLDQATRDEAIAVCIAHIDRIETGRYIIPGQLSLFELK